MNLSEIAFRYRRLIFVMLAVLLVYGALSYFTLPAREDPEITIREALVVTQYPGLTPERVENLITRKLEEEIRKIPEIERIKSTSSTGRSVIHVEILDRYSDLEPIWQNLRNKVNAAQGRLPDGTQPSVVNDEFGDVAVITLALTSEGFDMAAMFDMSKHVRDVLYGVEGTKKIDVLGVQKERIFLETSNAKLAQLGISPNALMQMLQSQNIIRPGGVVDTGAKSFIIEPTGNYSSLADIENTLISLPGTEDVLPLSDLTKVKRDFIDPPDQTSYFNGEPAIIFAISMLSGYNVLEYAPRMQQQIATVAKSLPIGFNLEIATYQAEQVAKTVYGVSFSVLQTLAIVLVVVMLFLGVRTGLIVGTIVPFVMLITLAIMQFSGMALERMSLATLIISLGLLVDNGIVIAEDFKRRLEQGFSREEALANGGRELAVPLLSSSLTTILVFLPLMLAEHVAGEYTRSISLVILIALLTSWVLALMVTPTLCYYFLKISPPTQERRESPMMRMFYNRYRGFLHWVLRHKLLFMVLMFALLIGAGQLMSIVPKQFFPDSDRAQILAYVELPAGSSARTTDRRMRDIFTWLNQGESLPHITSYSGYVGYGGPRFVLSLSPEDPADNKGFIVFNVTNLEQVGPTLEALREGFRQNFPDMFVRVTRMFMGPNDSSKLEIQVKGPDSDVIYAKAQEIATLFREIPGTTDIKVNWENRITKVQVLVDQKRARRSGVTSEDIARSMNAYFNGEQITEFREGDDIIPIIMRAAEGERFNLDRMRSMNVYSSARGTNVPLFQIADFAPVNQYARIDREDMFRTVTIEAKSLVMTAEDMKGVLDGKLGPVIDSLPPGHQIEYDGVITISAEAQQALSASMPMVVGLILVLLVGQFNSYRRPMIIVLTIPLALIGAVVGLFVTGSFMGFMVSLGLYSLAGIIVNNAIVLIDRIDIERAQGKEAYEAIVDACVMRLRPITMTTITTILGLLPLILARDPLFYGMSNAMAFGLGVGTILTLGVVPVLYALFFGVKRGEA
uniref:Putative AcrB/AcrD/AcrF family protein n=1 Tax=Magnetococcus massalia (strain MO-1) TaxID=451514 RepID=A0A1S7LCD3_MAGMO|nr:Putative AcrB/AcrD/AcrF family protein [Candidatus Magnetococcus massalia]